MVLSSEQVKENQPTRSFEFLFKVSATNSVYFSVLEVATGISFAQGKESW